MAEILSGYGSSLSQNGRFGRRRQGTKEALELAGELHNQVLIAQTLNYQGEDALYRGDVSAAAFPVRSGSEGKRRARPIAAFSC